MSAVALALEPEVLLALCTSYPGGRDRKRLSAAAAPGKARKGSGS